MTPVETADFAKYGVTLTSAAAPDFDARAQAIVGEKAELLFDLKPYLAIVQNQDPRTVVAYTVVWTTTLRNDTSELNYTQLKFPDAVAGVTSGLALLQGREIRRGEERLVGRGFEAWPPDYLDSYRDYGLSTIRQSGAAKRVEIALDAVIFEDGAILGRDEAHLGRHFIEYVRAKQSAYREIVEHLESGLGEEAFARLRAVASKPAPVTSADPFAGYPKMAAEEILALRDRVALEVFRRTLRREPFAIKRPSGTSD